MDFKNCLALNFCLKVFSKSLLIKSHVPTYVLGKSCRNIFRYILEEDKVGEDVYTRRFTLIGAYNQELPERSIFNRHFQSSVLVVFCILFSFYNY